MKGGELRNGDEDVASPSTNGEVLSSSPWERLRRGDEDVATPLQAGAVPGCTSARVIQVFVLFSGEKRERD